MLGALLGEALLRVWGLLAAGKPRGSAFSAEIARPDPRFGAAMIPGAKARHVAPEFDVAIEINERGFRQRSPPPRDRVAGKRRVAVVGDSFVFGWGVEEAERFTERLEAAVPSLEIANLGHPGASTEQSVLLFEERGGRELRADVVLLAHFIGAIARRGASVSTELSPDGDGPRPATPAVAAAQESRERGLPLPFKDALARHSELYRLLRATVGVPARTLLRSVERDPYPEYASDAPAWRATKGQFARLARDAADAGGRLAIVIVPEPWHVEPGAPDVHRRVIAEHYRAAGLPVLDLAPSLELRHYRTRDGHWNPAGHARAAEAIAVFLARESLLPQAGAGDR